MIYCARYVCTVFAWWCRVTVDMVSCTSLGTCLSSLGVVLTRSLPCNYVIILAVVTSSCSHPVWERGGGDSIAFFEIPGKRCDYGAMASLSLDNTKHCKEVCCYRWASLPPKCQPGKRWNLTLSGGMMSSKY